MELDKMQKWKGNMENYEVKDIVNLPSEYIDQIQKQLDEQNCAIIMQAYNEHRISPNEKDYLLGFYSDGMSVYREVYRALYEIFRQPENTCAINLATGKVDTDAHGNKINYGLKAVTPFTCTRLEYVDKFHNSIYVILPKMKSVIRAIEKIESEYNTAYFQEMHKMINRFFEDENRELLIENMQGITQNSSKLRDVLRLTITCKYFTDVERIKRIMTNYSNNAQSNFYINPNETRDKFLQPLNKNEKNYFDIKMIMHQKTANGQPINVEVQIKIHTLYTADTRTHKLYEKLRALEGELALKGNKIPQEERRQKEAQIKILKHRIRTINANAIHHYNMIVLDKARRIEDDGYRPLRIPPDNIDGTYNQCRSVIANEYRVESFAPFNPDTDFAANKEVNKVAFLRMIGKLDDEFDETEENAHHLINYEFSRLTPSEKERFDGINEIAQRYASVINCKIDTLRKEETQNITPKTRINLDNNGR